MLYIYIYIYNWIVFNSIFIYLFIIYFLVCVSQVLIHIMCKFLCAPHPLLVSPTWQKMAPQKIDHSYEIIPCLKNETTTTTNAWCGSLFIFSRERTPQEKLPSYDLKSYIWIWFRGEWLFLRGSMLVAVRNKNHVLWPESSLVVAPSTLSPPPNCICCLCYFPVSVCIAVYQID